MHVYVNGAWAEGFLDAAPSSRRPLVSIWRQVALEPVTQQFFVRKPDLAMLASYLRMLGVRQVVRKVRSRRNEVLRNDAWLSVGVGTLYGDPASGAFAFALPTAPRALERAVIHRDLLFKLPDHDLGTLPSGHFVPAGAPDLASSLGDAPAAELHALAGWRPEEGTTPTLTSATWRSIEELVKRPGPAFTETASQPPASEPRHHVDRIGSAARERPSYHCFGYGQYAKTQIIPNLSRHMRLLKVHEIDPIQIGPIADSDHGWDTLPHPRAADAISNAVVASFHHTHAPIAVDLLDRGVGHIIIEKPVATTTAQLDDLLAALKRRPDAEVHVAFQRRYSPFNAPLLHDLDGPPISMAGTVYEVPLPTRHWYRWPIVGNSIVSNGCHWIDHFLFLNDYASVGSLQVHRLTTQVAMSIELENGASAVITLRHAGAPLRGVRDVCVFWKDDASATIIDSRRYVSERGYRTINSKRAHPYQAHRNMYREFAKRIAEDAPGDDCASLDLSTRTMLQLACLLDESGRTPPVDGDLTAPPQL